MTIKRSVARIETPIEQPGFLGRGHMARPVVSGSYAQTDPFIFLMDDVLDKEDDVPVGGPHPHAGFETVSLLLEGEIGDETHKMKTGDFQIMTAGSGIVHSEIIDKPSRMRLLQLWINLPRMHRTAKPRVQDLPSERVLKFSTEGVHIKLYSGFFAGLQSPIENYVPMIITDITIEPGVTTTQILPANFNTFLYVLNGNMEVGENSTLLSRNQVGWLDITANETQSELRLTAGNEGVRFVLYAAKPLGENIVNHGPFIADSSEDILRIYQQYREGKMQHISSVSSSQRIQL